jgi:LmbE family N-acetylglucosaminyl deacetylase
MAGSLGSLEVNKVMCFSPHPDDSEIMAGGTLARWASEGVEVILCVVTNGACGSNDPDVYREDLIATRQREQRNAAVILGASEVIFLGHEDGFVEDSHELRKDIIREIRRHKPDVVIGPDPSLYYFQQWYVNHPDHRRVGEAFLAAVNPGVTTVPLYREELYDKGFEPHSVKACMLLASPSSDYFVDIGDFIHTKIAALDAHASQKETWTDSGMAVRGIGSAMAALSGESYEYAEAFKTLFFGPETGASPFPDTVGAASGSTADGQV